MRAPFQVLVIPYRRTAEGMRFCVFHRADRDIWQFVSGGGEDDETPPETARRELFEETGIETDSLLPLKSLTYIRTNVYSAVARAHWPEDLYVLPEYSFAFECEGEPVISDEHTGFAWLTYDEARRRLEYDSNRTAMYEAMCIVEHRNARDGWE